MPSSVVAFRPSVSLVRVNPKGIPCFQRQEGGLHAFLPTLAETLGVTRAPASEDGS